MRKLTRIYSAAVLALALATLPGAAQSQTNDTTIAAIRGELTQLPYYGVFDFLAFKYSKGTVTLGGYAYHPMLKTDAERAVKRVAGVDAVVNNIDDLPPSFQDDEVRWRAYYAIYRDPILSRYAPGGATVWGHRHELGARFYPLASGPFSGMEPAGDYPIHIVVNGDKVTLLGVVDGKSDRTVAEAKARDAAGSLTVENQLMVEIVRQPRTTQ